MCRDRKCMFMVMVDYDILGSEIVVKLFFCVCGEIEVILLLVGYELEWGGEFEVLMKV